MELSPQEFIKKLQISLINKDVDNMEKLLEFDITHISSLHEMKEAHRLIKEVIFFLKGEKTKISQALQNRKRVKQYGHEKKETSRLNFSV